MNRNAYIGSNVEALFANSIGDNPRAIKAIQEHFGIQGKFLSAIRTGIHAEKGDVKMEKLLKNHVKHVEIKILKLTMKTIASL